MTALQNPESIRHFQSLCDACQALAMQHHGPSDLRLYADGYLHALRRSSILDPLAQRRLETKTEQLTRQRDIEMEKVERQLGGKVRQEQDRQKWLAVLLPPIPPLVVAFFVYFRRRAQEREGVAKTRLR